MFNFFKKKNNMPISIHAVATGTLVPISEVNDVVFAQKAMGEGFAILPENGQITSPVTGKITSVFPSQHAIGIVTDGGLEVLVHMGIDTVELNGEGFQTQVGVGDKVTPDTVLSQVDLALLNGKGKETAMIVVFPNTDAIAEFNLQTTGAVKALDTIANVTLK